MIDFERRFGYYDHQRDSYPSQRTPWGILEILVTIVLVVLLENGFVFIYALLGADKVSPIAGVSPQLFFFTVSGLVQTLAFLLLISAVVKLRWHRSLAEVGLKWCGWKDLLLTGVAGGVLVMMLVFALMYLITLFTHSTPNPQPFTQMLFKISNPTELALLIALGGLIAPFGEEIYFRGFVYPGLLRYGKLAAIIISSAFFGAMHLDLLRFLPLSVGGACLALIADKSRSILPSWAAHSIWNITMILLMFVGRAI